MRHSVTMKHSFGKSYSVGYAISRTLRESREKHHDILRTIFMKQFATGLFYIPIGNFISRPAACPSGQSGLKKEWWKSGPRVAVIGAGTFLLVWWPYFGTKLALCPDQEHRDNNKYRLLHQDTVTTIVFLNPDLFLKQFASKLFHVPKRKPHTKTCRMPNRAMWSQEGMVKLHTKGMWSFGHYQVFLIFSLMAISWHIINFFVLTRNIEITTNTDYDIETPWQQPSSLIPTFSWNS